MKKDPIAAKLKELRKAKGFSQYEVADKAQINLRTVQRIENGETEPRGDTLHRLAKVFDIEFEKLADQTIRQNNSLSVLLNLSALVCIVFPLLGITVPLLIWILKKEENPDLKETGKRLLNFQITWSLFSTAYYLFILSIEVFHLDIPLPTFKSVGRPEAFVIIPNYLFRAVNAVYILINAYRSYHFKKVFYKPALKFFW